MKHSRSINKPTRGQRGTVLVWFALLLPVLLGFAGLAIDAARLYLIKTELQNAADAAALAGAYKYAKTASLSAATAEATNLATRNQANGASIPAASVDPTEKTGTGYGYAIRVVITLHDVNVLFGPFLGMSTSNVYATAVAAANAVVPPAVPTPILVQ